MSHSNSSQNIADQSSGLLGNSRNIIIILIVFYILLDTSERFLEIKYDSWVYIVLFMLLAMGVSLWGVGLLEKSLNDTLKN